MTRFEAQLAMMQGERVRHVSFTDDEWIRSDESGSMIYTEEDYNMFASIFWRNRASEYWDKDWETVKL